MTKRVKRFTTNYNGETIKPNGVIVPFEYTDGDTENWIYVNTLNKKSRKTIPLQKSTGRKRTLCCKAGEGAGSRR